MNRTRVFVTAGLVLALSVLFSPARQAFAANSNERTVTLEVHGML